jgi:type I restriction enzyme, S subunit
MAPREEQSKLLEQIESCLTTPEVFGQMATDYEQQLDQLDHSILAKAFHGELVLQDPNDEPASALKVGQAEATKRNKQTSEIQWGNKTGKKLSRLTPQQLTLTEVLTTKD